MDFANFISNLRIPLIEKMKIKIFTSHRMSLNKTLQLKMMGQ
jgi:hypothetical protein